MVHFNNIKDFQQAVKAGQVNDDETVWRGDDGSYVVADWSEWSGNESDVQYVEAGTVAEYK